MQSPQKPYYREEGDLYGFFSCLVSAIQGERGDGKCCYGTLQMNRKYEELKSSAHTSHATNLYDLLHERLIYWEGHRPTFHIQESSHISVKDNTLK